ncbi:hypothetical protein [Alteromonas halophila]|uniref:Uncharacterized protein n=1 Tax=Alteromonas halophila TaxID=516698 RepID=A0A918MXY4_9ALTE|nr:hypothetical protein [Alteromonas halophila]GGW86088.1 hypothetical protein GCM10007391_19680 [Alteromonas halophila]
MTFKRQGGYAFTELLIASALFCAGLLTQVTLNRASVRSLSDLTVADQRDNHMQSVMRFAAIAPTTPQQVRDNARALQGVSVTVRSSSLPAPLTQAEITAGSASAQAGVSYPMVMTGQHAGHWQDVTALVSL